MYDEVLDLLAHMFILKPAVRSSLVSLHNCVDQRAGLRLFTRVLVPNMP